MRYRTHWQLASLRSECGVSAMKRRCLPACARGAMVHKLHWERLRTGQRRIQWVSQTT